MDLNRHAACALVAEGGDQPNVQKSVAVAMSNFASLIERLLATPDGGISLLHNSAILGFSECSEGKSHNAMEQPGIPCIVAGRGGGSLVHPGIHYKSPHGPLTAEHESRLTAKSPRIRQVSPRLRGLSAKRVPSAETYRVSTVGMGSADALRSNLAKAQAIESRQL